MENLNAEQIIKALEWAIEKEFCSNCLCTAYGESIVEFYKEILAFINSQEQKIKELTEENERLSAEVSVKKKLLDKCVDLEDRVKADTVRKMQEKLKAKVTTDYINGTREQALSVIDQIAKEMLEGKDEIRD